MTLKHNLATLHAEFHEHQSINYREIHNQIHKLIEGLEQLKQCYKANTPGCRQITHIIDEILGKVKEQKKQ